MDIFLFCVFGIFYLTTQLGYCFNIDDSTTQREKRDDGIFGMATQAVHRAKQNVDKDNFVRKSTSSRGGQHSHRFNQLVTSLQDAAKVQQIGHTASVALRAVQEILDSQQAQLTEIQHSPKWNTAFGSALTEICPFCFETSSCDRYAIYRTADGSCNNLEHAEWGKSFTGQKRYLPSAYEDGLQTPRTHGCGGTTSLPSPRRISNIVHKGTKTPESTRLTAMVMQWGQFLAHDIVSTPIFKESDGSDIQCTCGEQQPECFPIPIPGDDPFFTDKQCMHFVRSVPVVGANSVDVRQQLNVITSYIDGSSVYGSSLKEFEKLRNRLHGKMKTGPHNQLPPNDKNNCQLQDSSEYCADAGDIRANVIPSLGVSHTLFMREHNRISENLANVNPHWTFETLFQETRKIIAAEIQHITYSEYLPLVLGADFMENYYLRVGGDDYEYDNAIDASLKNVFGAAAFRFGHSQIPRMQKLMSDDYKNTTSFGIEKTYHRVTLIQTNNGTGVSGIARWLVTEPSPETDRQFDTGVRDLLFLKDDGKSLDLAALNIQRAREHGIPPYNDWRQWCGLPRAEHFGIGAGGLTNHSEETALLLQKAYSCIDDIDLLTGAVSEIHAPDAEVGPTFACILARQFYELKFGDRFWYEKIGPTGFNAEQLQEIRKMKLSKLIAMNTDITDIQTDVFTVPLGNSNERVPGEALPDIDFTKWLKTPIEINKAQNSCYVLKLVVTLVILTIAASK